ncbi:hypothetical protein ZIOFF_058301 [Zingiber officinale]|uniref:Uncharacterized protein n=1 Tax=Zingiber officinale TaxID=94328 RepID=A0A8J5KJ65_ZINOF|nr:hypothetical protein ZIOFF_058301 [Zingiber officinale]
MKVIEVPKNYIIDRCRKDIKRGYQSINNIYDDYGCDGERHRYNILTPLIQEVQQLGAKNDDNFSVLVEILKDAKEKLIAGAANAACNASYQIPASTDHAISDDFWKNIHMISKPEPSTVAHDDEEVDEASVEPTDIKLVMTRAGVPRSRAVNALKAAKGHRRGRASGRRPISGKRKDNALKKLTREEEEGRSGSPQKLGLHALFEIARWENWVAAEGRENARVGDGRENARVEKLGLREVGDCAGEDRSQGFAALFENTRVENGRENARLGKKERTRG